MILPKTFSEAKDAAHYFYSLMFDVKLREAFPLSLETDEKALSLQSAILETREVLQKVRSGRYDYEVTIKGTIGGLLKALQSNLRHAAWTARCVSEGDFSQRIDFMGEFSDAFNLMTQRLAEASQSLKDEAERWRLALECSRDGVWDIDMREPERSFFSRNFFELVGDTPETLSPIHTWPDFIHLEDAEAREIVRSCLEGSYPGNTLNIAFRLQCRDGAFRWRSAKGQIFRDEERRITRVIGVLEDIQGQKEREADIARRAMHDSLTGLPNRELFNQHMRQMMAYARRTGTCLALAMVDLDKFKQVNDTLGHHAGDLLLVEVARRLQQCLRQSDLVARLGGDEFALLLPCNTNNHEGIFKVMERLQTNLNKPMLLEKTSYSITASLGLAIYPHDGDELLPLMKRADEAMYRAKASGRNAFCFWREG